VRIARRDRAGAVEAALLELLQQRVAMPADSPAALRIAAIGRREVAAATK
jgi:hypothetical protein